jgi:hypothetical protein
MTPAWSGPTGAGGTPAATRIGTIRTRTSMRTNFGGHPSVGMAAKLFDGPCLQIAAAVDPGGEEGDLDCRIAS